MNDNTEQKSIIKKAYDLEIAVINDNNKINQISSMKFRQKPSPPQLRVEPKPSYPPVKSELKPEYKDLLNPTIKKFCIYIIAWMIINSILSDSSITFLTILNLIMLSIGVYMICKFLFAYSSGKTSYEAALAKDIERIENSPQYIEQCAELDRLRENQQNINDAEYERQMKEYTEQIIPQYESEFAEWEKSKYDSLNTASQQLQRDSEALRNLYNTTKILPTQYRTPNILKYIYDTMDSSNYDVKTSIEIYDRQVQQQIDSARLREARIANEQAEIANQQAYEQNLLLNEQNEIAEQAREDAKRAAFVAAVQRHNTNKALKNMRK